VDLLQYLKVLRKRWPSILIPLILGLFLGWAATATTTPMYKTSAQLFVAVGGQADSGSSVQGNASFALQRMSSYPAVVTSPLVTAPAAAELGIPESEVAGAITATVTPQTFLLTVTATGSDSSRLAVIANTVAITSARVIQEIETPPGTASSPLRVSLTTPALTPGAPFEPKPLINLGLGFIVGLGSGLLLALLREQLDRRLRSSDDVRELTRAPVMAAIPFDQSTPKEPLIGLHGASRRGEAYRSLRTNLRYANVDDHLRCVVVTSSVPGEGKSVTACNLALAMGLTGAKVCLVEGDLRAGRAAGYLGVANEPGLTDVLAGEVRVDQALIPWNRGVIHFLPRGTKPPNPAELLSSQQMVRLLNHLRGMFDIVIIDAPPLLPITDAALLSRIADGALILVRYGKTTRDQLATATAALERVGARTLGAVVNFVPTGRKHGKSGYGYGYGYGYGDANPTEQQPTQPPIPVTPATHPVAAGPGPEHGMEHR